MLTKMLTGILGGIVVVVVICLFITQTSHIKNGLRTLKNQYFNPQNSNHAALCPYFNASCIYFGSL